MDQKEIQEKLNQYKKMQESLQYFISQKQELSIKIGEIDNAIKELENYNGKVYKITGTIFIEKDKDETLKMLREEKDIVNIRIKSIERQEQQLKERIAKLGAELQSILSSEGYGQTGG